jgi:uncharacterized membrane protein YqaE (UPF0057 family)
MNFNKLYIYFGALGVFLLTSLISNAASTPVTDNTVSAEKVIRKETAVNIQKDEALGNIIWTSRPQFSSNTSNTIPAVYDSKRESSVLQSKIHTSEKNQTASYSLLLLSLLLPLLVVTMHQRKINRKFWITACLTPLLWIPAAVYAIFVITNE